MALHCFDDATLQFDRCPHCAVATPLLTAIHHFPAETSRGEKLKWAVYICSRCGRPVVGGCPVNAIYLEEIYPQTSSLSDDIPPKAAAFLAQATESLHAPSGAVMLCASSVDAMLKEKGLKKGNLYSRIEEAARSGLITKEMAAWAHEVRLDANDERHADDNAGLPNEEDAKKCIDFVRALADFMFVLPARVERGRSSAK
jgi:hypothetical protein